MNRFSRIRGSLSGMLPARRRTCLRCLDTREIPSFGVAIMKRTLSIQRDSSGGTYFVRLQFENVRKRFWLGTSKKGAIAKLKDLQKDIAAGTITFTTTETTATTSPSGRRDMRLEELAHRYLESVEKDMSRATYATRRYSILAFVEFVGATMVSQITRLKVMDFYVWARKHHGRGPNGGNHYMRDVRTMFRWGAENEVCDNPVVNFPKIHHTPPLTKRLSDEDMVTLLRRLPTGDFKDMVVFGLLTGLRPYEVRLLAKTHVVRTADGHAHLCIEQHKTAKMTSDPVPRTVPLSTEALAIVDRQVKQHPRDEHIFLTERGTPYSKDTFYQRIERWCARAKIKRRSPYSLRHTFASRQAEGGTNIVSLAQLMGHTSTKTTARYISSTEEHHRRVVEQNAASILGLLASSEAKAETGPKSGQKVASNSEPGKQEDGRNAGTP